MKKIAILLGFVAAFLCFAQSANAQYSTQIFRKGADFVDLNGRELSNAELVDILDMTIAAKSDIVGADIYNKTVVGARKQFKVGRGLIWGGCAGIVGGVAEMVAGTILVRNSAPRDPQARGINTTRLGNAMVAFGGVMVGVGAVALTVGIPFVAIGKGRLNWVEDQTKPREWTYKLGVVENGVGLALNF